MPGVVELHARDWSHGSTRTCHLDRIRASQTHARMQWAGSPRVCCWRSQPHSAAPGGFGFHIGSHTTARGGATRCPPDPAALRASSRIYAQLVSTWSNALVRTAVELRTNDFLSFGGITDSHGRERRDGARSKAPTPLPPAETPLEALRAVLRPRFILHGFPVVETARMPTYVDQVARSRDGEDGAAVPCGLRRIEIRIGPTGAGPWMPSSWRATCPRWRGRSRRGR